MVMNETEVPDEAFRTAVRQLRDQGGLRELGRRLKDDQLRALHEQSAMVGTFMALTWKSHKQSPQPPEVWTNVRDAARQPGAGAARRPVEAAHRRRGHQPGAVSAGAPRAAG